MPDVLLDFPPSGLDYADGIAGRPGTPTPVQVVDISPLAIFLEEEPESPDIERGEQCTIRHVFNMDWVTGTIMITGLGRGVYMQDSGGNVTRILTCDLRRKRGGRALLSITSESISFDTPPDEFDVEDVELNPAIEKHPKFRPITGDGVTTFGYNLDSNGNKLDPTIYSGYQIVTAAKNAANAATQIGGSDTLSQLNSTNIPDTTVLPLSKQLYNRYLRLEDTFYLVGWKVVWSQYYFAPQELDGGGYIQDPVTSGALPAYFWSTTGDITGQNVFTVLAAATNPLIYGNGISWLRLADKQNFSRTWFRITRAWLGGPLGTWDGYIYPPAPIFP